MSYNKHELDRATRISVKLFGKNKTRLLASVYKEFGKGEVMDLLLQEKGFIKLDADTYVNKKEEVKVQLKEELIWGRFNS